MLRVTNRISIPMSEIEMVAIRAQGPGGQNVNKTSSAIHLRFDIRASSMPDWHKGRVLGLSDSRLTADGIIVIKAQNHRTQERNKTEALARLKDMLQTAFAVQKKRRPTKPSKSAVKRRLEKKTQRGAIKKTRGRVRRSDD